MAETLGGAALTGIVITHSHTCYLGDRTHKHAWGYGCGACPACQLRAKGYLQWRGLHAL
jgi:7-cyano-7-deazaguanine synthase